MNSDNVEYCRRVADKLDIIVSDYAYIDDDMNVKDARDYDGSDNLEQYTLCDWIQENVLDVQYICDSMRRMIDVRVYVTLGGPTCWIDTESCCVKLTWGTESASYGLDWDTCDGIRDYFAEWYNDRA